MYSIYIPSFFRINTRRYSSKPWNFKCLCLLVLICSSLYSSNAQEPLLTNVYNRNTHSLNGYWKYIIDPYENGYYNYRYEAFDQQPSPWASAFFLNSKPKDKSDLIEYDFDQMDSLMVPGDWNSQKPELLYYEGTVWYMRYFDDVRKDQTKRLFLHFGASNYKSEVYLNGQKLGIHVGGFTPFNFDVSDHLKSEKNCLVVKVDNKRVKEGIPTLNTDWWNYGGITRDVKLLEVPDNFIESYKIQLDKHKADLINIELSMEGSDIANQKLRLEIPELKIDQIFRTNAKGRISASLTNAHIVKWSIDNPKLYDVILSSDEERIKDQIGFRTIKTQGTDILLNDKSVYLKGISIHEESPIRGGRGNSKADAQQLLNWAKELGCNYVRLAHYPHNEHMIRLADEMGIMVWEENPVYWTIDWNNPNTYANAENQLSELIQRDQNRASVIIWSMANETPNSDDRNNFLKKLADFANAKDDTRLISAALEQKNYNGDPLVRTISDPFAESVDILSFNQYIGWYDGLPDKCEKITWHITQNKPVLISEFGAGAKAGLHGGASERWTEEYQELLYINTLDMLNKIPQVKGMSPWILVDFKSPRRVLPKIQDGWNRKGLISDKGEKKKAFHILRRFYLSKDR